MNVTGKKIAVLGLGESGFKTALFLHKRGVHIFASESAANDELRERQRILAEHDIPCEIGGHTIATILESSLVVISPGISPQTPIYQTLHKKQVDILSEVEVASRFFKGDLIAVTGTDGKTTVTTLIREILTGSGLKAISCGNIGNPFISELDQLERDTKVVLEVSSFQLYHIRQFKPKVAALLNIAPDHLDWHYNYKDYIDAKARLFANQTSTDFAILNFQDPIVQDMACRIKAKKLFFNQFPSELDANRDAALCICDVYGLDKQRASAVLKAFPGVEHRLEHVPTDDGIQYINDSKSTSLHSLTWALSVMKNKVILLCGGRNKGLDFTTVRDSIKRGVRYAVLYGEAQDEIMQAWQDCIPCYQARTLEHALTQARDKARRGDTILLSPACTSFDMFKNYKERGEVFKKLVHELCPKNPQA